MTLSLHPFENIHSEDYAFGAAGAAASLTGGYVALKGSDYLMGKWSIQATEPQTYFRYFEHLQAISNSLLRGALKVLAVFYVIVLVPIVEEWIFRDVIYQWQEEGQASKVYRVISNGILFGVFHISVFHGIANIPIVAVTTIAGLVFAALREMRGNRYASTIAHSINNAFVLFLSFLKV